MKYWLPRARGDRPVITLSHTSIRPASPRARGSTLDG